LSNTNGARCGTYHVCTRKAIFNVCAWGEWVPYTCGELKPCPSCPDGRMCTRLSRLV
jgi:hypothetical protein